MLQNNSRDLFANKNAGWAGQYRVCRLSAAPRPLADRAFAAFDKAVEVRDPGLLTFKRDPFLNPIRRDPRYAALPKRLKFPT